MTFCTSLAEHPGGHGTRRYVLAAGLLVSVWFVGGCDGGLESPTPLTSASMELSSTSDSAVALPSTGVTYEIDGTVSEYQWTTSFPLIVAVPPEFSGVTITSVSLTLQQASGGILVAPPPGQTEQYFFNPTVTGNRVESGSETTIVFDVWYTTPNVSGRADAVITVTVGALTDDGVALSSAYGIAVAS